MWEAIILGLIQGFAEWLPVSSKGLIILVKTYLFNDFEGIEEALEYAAFLHIGTFFAALIYLRKDVLAIIKTLINYKSADSKDRNLLKLLTFVTIVSSIVGGAFFSFAMNIAESFEVTGKYLNALVGFFLLITGGLLIRRKGKVGTKTSEHITWKDILILGLVQAFAVIPGLSRSGLTISTFLFLKYDDNFALRASFLMSMPIVLAANVYFGMDGFDFNREILAGLIAAFIIGIFSIHFFLKLALKVNFGRFVIGFGLLMILAAFV